MSSEHVSPNRYEDNSVPRLSPAEEFVALAKGLLDLKHIKWEQSAWNVTEWCRNRSKTRTWQFVEDGVPFDDAFADVAKAALVYQTRVNAAGPATLINWLVPLRSLYRVVRRVNDGSPRFVGWDDITLRDWQRAEDDVVSKTSPMSRYQYVGNLQSFARLLEARGVVPRVQYKHRQTRPRDTGIRHIEDRDAAMDKLPPVGALHDLADAAQNPENDRDRMLFAVVKLLVALGFRVGEVLTLPADCWRVERQGRASLLYWPEKGGPLVPKAIPGVAQDLVRDAVEILLELTEEARQRAHVLEADPTRVPLLGDHLPDEMVGTSQLSKAMQLERSGVQKYLDRLGIPPSTKRDGTHGKPLFWRVGELECALAAALPEHRYELVLPHGDRQRLSEFLCVVPKVPRNGQPSLLTVRPLPASALEGFLTSSRTHTKSVFERYELFDGEGRPWSITTHQFRHWINTVASKGGLSGMELARWMGRKDIRQNLSYQHLNLEERIERAKEGVRSGKMLGPMSEVYHRLPAYEKEAFLDAQVEAAHISPYGTCTQDFATKPCPYDMQCITGCGSFLRTKGDRREIVAIQQVRRRAKLNVEAAHKATQEGLPEAANWVESQRRLYEGAEQALAVEETQEVPEGKRVQAFPDAPSLGGGSGSVARR